MIAIALALAAGAIVLAALTRSKTPPVDDSVEPADESRWSLDWFGEKFWVGKKGVFNPDNDGTWSAFRGGDSTLDGSDK